MGQIMLHIPTSVPDTQPLKLAPRPGTLRGARLALLDNGKEFSDQVLDAVGEVMKRDYDVGRGHRRGVPGQEVPAAGTRGGEALRFAPPGRKQGERSEDADSDRRSHRSGNDILRRFAGCDQ